MENSNTIYHVPVLLKESVDGLDVRPGGVYVDVTFGGGGHSREILRRMDGGRLFSFDQDADAEANIRLADGLDTRGFTFVRSNFRYLKNWMRYYGVEHINGLLADLGVSSHHLDDEERGFSFRFCAPLDMRMNKRGGITARDVVNGYSEERLADVLYLYGEMRNSRLLARLIAQKRQQKSIATTGDLVSVVERALPKTAQKKDLARIFQALRIEVNHEMDALGEMLLSAKELLSKGGRMSVITYHSLEDRLVKNVMRSGNLAGRVESDFFGNRNVPFSLVTSRVILPKDEETAENPRARSAKLRIAEKL